MKKFLTILFVLVAALFYSQSLTPTGNYVYSRNYLEAVTSEQPNASQIQGVQYYDGLGRSTQNIAIKATPTGKDLVVPIVYDDSGKQTKSYLPLPVDSQNGAFFPNVGESNVNSYYGVQNAYSEVLYEKSPLGRIEKQAAPGAEWQMGGTHIKKIEYLFNASNDVKRLKAITAWNSSKMINDVSIETAQNDAYTTNGYYNANTLYKIVSKDEDGNEVQKFTNSGGQNIMLRKVNKKGNGTIEYQDTYYVYDEFNNLSFIIPPKAAVFSNITDLKEKLNALCYQYKYDKYNRQVEKKLPGKGWEYLVYDQQNRLVLSQDANLRSKGQWLFSKYDLFGRVIYTGIANGGSREAEQNNVNAKGINNEQKSASSWADSGLNIYYTNSGAYPNAISKVFSVNYYDEYPIGAPSLPAQIQNQQTLPAVPVSITSNGLTSVRSTKTLPTASYIKNIENDSWSSSFVWYDTKARVIGTHSNNYLGGFTRTESLLNFIGKPQEFYTYHSKNTASAQVTVKDRFVYNLQSVLIKHYQQINANPEELLSEYTYNDLGQLTNKKVGNNLQSVDYTYNIRGWLSGINAGDLNNLGNKLFAYKIKHTEREGVETPNNEYPELKVTPHYNGSITETDWKIAADNVKRRYGYTYDATSRMTGGFYQTDTNPYLKEYNEIVDYDLNGNIASLKRTSFSMAGTPLIIDDLTYAYDGNRLTTVSDASQNYTGYPANTPSLIDYDENGNMISLKDKGISQIVYNHLDLPSYVTYAQSYFVHDNITGLDVEKNVNTQYTYRSDGTKLKAEYTYVTGKGKIETKRKTDYLDNFQYENDVLQFTANEEGYYDFKNNRYIYNYTDHLGNVRVSYYKNTTTGNATILEENHYYPLGLRHTGYSPTLAGNAYRYKYNGKELQENGMLDYGWRNYIPELGRWGVMDQLSENYHMASPYAYVMNNPVSLIDPDGRNVHETATGWTFDGADISLIMSYLRNGGGVKHLTQELSVWGGGGGGGGGTSMYGGAISSFWSSFNSGGILGGVSVSGGYLSWWTNGAPASGNSIQGVDNHKTKIEQNSFNSFMNGLTNLKNYFSSLNKDFTSLANNQYFSAGHLITSESVSRFGAYSLSKALKPDYSVNYTVLDDAAKPYRITTMAGIKMKPATAATLSKVAKFGGYFLAGVSVYATEAQYADGSIGDTERWANHIMTGVGMVPTPWTMGIALGYGIITGGYQAITGRSIFNDMGLGPQKK